MDRRLFSLLTVLVALAAACGGGQETAPRSDPARVEAAPLDQSRVDAGGLIYAAGCAQCHGAQGAGAENWKVRGSDGALLPPPQDATGHTWHHGDGLLAQIIREGCAAYQVGSAPCNMPAFPSLTDGEIEAVLEFLKSWWGPDERAFQATVSENDPFPRP